jgi:hypothetical protein
MRERLRRRIIRCALRIRRLLPLTTRSKLFALGRALKMYLELIVCRFSQAGQARYIEASPCQEKAPPSDWQLGTPQSA